MLKESHQDKPTNQLEQWSLNTFRGTHTWNESLNKSSIKLWTQGEKKIINVPKKHAASFEHTGDADCLKALSSSEQVIKM